MKSTVKNLESRGYLKDPSVSEKNLGKNELFKLLNNPEAVKRSLAARLLGERFILSSGTDKELLERLVIEKKLYTRLEICGALQKGDAETARVMIPYINRIGKNQYQDISEAKTSRKKSYPLPRDIICRTLGKMNKDIAPVLADFLTQKSYYRELIDSLGTLIFYTPSLQTKDYFLKGKEAYDLFKDDLLFVWKFITFCSAFPAEFSEELLSEIESLNKEEIFRSEIKRTQQLSKIHEVFF